MTKEKHSQERTKVSIHKQETLFDKLKALFIKYYDVIAYLFFGVCTTVVNIVVYAICAKVLHFNTVVSTTIAWILSVAFAYITNRIWVFKSKVKDFKGIMREICSFVAARLATGVLDLLIMYVFVDLLHWPDMIIKVASNILVIVLNYIASKLFIFAKPKKQSKKAD